MLGNCIVSEVIGSEKCLHEMVNHTLLDVALNGLVRSDQLICGGEGRIIRRDRIRELLKTCFDALIARLELREHGDSSSECVSRRERRDE